MKRMKFSQTVIPMTEENKHTGLPDFIELMKQGEKLIVHNCSMCGYPCGFIIDKDGLGYDTGCYCVRDCPRIEDRTESELAEYINPTGAYYNNGHYVNKWDKSSIDEQALNEARDG